MSDSTVGCPPNEAASLDPSLEGLLSEQVRDWMRGERPPIRLYLDRQPVLHDRPAVLIELINQEVVLRQMRGETPRPEDYLAEFPELSESLMHLFEVHGAVSAPTGLNDGQATGSTLPDPNAERGDVAKTPCIPGYDIERLLGRGGMGIVYLARHHALNRKVALKLLQEGHQDDPAHRARFEREAAAVAKCQHPNLVQIHEIGQHQGQFYLALEYVEGGNLARALAGKPQPPRLAAALVETLARAIEHAHSRGVVHRDLKPANVLLTPDGQPKITDFGLAKLKDSSSRTEVGTMLGTLAYMAPEQVRGESGVIGPRADIHALGAILYEALTGRPPYRAETPEKTFHAILSEEVVPPSGRQRGIPRNLEAICLKCLEKDSKRRYATAADLAEDLRRFLDGRPTMARPSSPAERSVRWCRRNPWIAASVAALFLGTIISTWQAVRATIAERSARRAETATRKEWERAETEVEINKAVNEFLNKDMLAQASAYNQASLNRKPDPDLKVRTALDRAAETIGERFANRPLVEAAIRLTIGETYYYLGLFPQARLHLERALQLRRGVLGAEDPETLNAMVIVGTVFQADGKTAEAERLLVPAMAGLRKTRGAGHLDTLAAMNAVGELYVGQDKLAEAEALFSRTIDGFRAARGAEHVETLQAMNNLANVYLTQKKPEQAERLLHKAVKSLQEKVGDEHPGSLIAMNNLAIALNAIGKRQEAEALWKDVLRIQRRVQGDTHPDTLVTMVTIGEFYLLQHRYDVAEPLLLDALKGCREALDRNHLATDAALALLSALYVNKRELKKAEPYLIEAMEITRSRFGPDDGMTAWATQLVGAILVTQKEYARAEPYLRDFLASYVKMEPEGSNRFATESWLGICLLGLKKYAEAESRLLSAYEGINTRKDDRPPGERSPPLNVLDRIIELYDAWGKKTQAEEWRTKRADLGFPDDPFAKP